MATAGAPLRAPSTCRRPRSVRRRRPGGRTRVATGGDTVAPVAPVEPWPAAPVGSWLVMALPPRTRRPLLALVDQRLRGLLALSLRRLDVAGEDGLVDHLDP